MQATKKDKKATSAGKLTATAKTLPHNAVNSLAAEIEAATTALIGDEEPRHGCVADEHSLIMFSFGERQDREIVATPDEVTITSKAEPSKTVKFTVNRWAHFTKIIPVIDDEAKELNRKTRPVAFRRHIGDGYYVSVNDGVMCVDIRQFFVPYGLQPSDVRPTKSGIALRLDEWVELLNLVPLIHQVIPSLARAKPCYDEHLAQLDRMACRSCDPFGPYEPFGPY